MSDHIKIHKAEGTWTVRADGAVLAESENALELVEGSSDPVIYFPRADIGMAFLEPSETRSHCPFKGDASYYSIHASAGLIPDAGWSYESPKDGVARIRDHIAFYPHKVTVERI